MEIKSSYYAIIPALVRYNENIPANAKLLYGEITALCNKKGYCYASNKYFANLYNVSNNTVSNWVSSLISEGFIRIFVSQEDGNQRKIWLTSKEFPVEGLQENMETYPKKAVHNNTVNSTNNNIYKQSNLIDLQTKWNDAFKGTNVPTIISVTGTRRTHLIKRFKENQWTIEDWSAYLNKIKK